MFVHTNKPAGMNVVSRRLRVELVVDWVCAAVASLVVVPTAILTTRVAQRLLLTIMLLNISLQVQKHFFLREDVRDLGSLGGLQLSLTNLALAGLCCAWLIGIALRPVPHLPARRILDRTTLPAVLLLGFYVMSLISASDKALWAFEVMALLGQFLLFLYIARTTSSREDVLFIVRTLLIGLVIQSILMLAQAGGLVGELDWYGIKARSEYAGDSRVSGTLGSPNPAAAYLAMMMSVSLGMFLARVGPVDKCLASFGVAVAALPLLFTFSRGGWISFLVGVAVIAIVGGFRLSRKVVVVAMVLVFMVIPFREAIEQRLYGDDNGSAASRKPLNELALVMIEDRPLSGVGANNFAVAMKRYLPHGFQGEFLYTVHNKYVLVWAEIGLGGLIAFVWLLIAIVREGAKCWRLRDPLFSPLVLGCSAAMVGVMVQMNFEPSRAGAESQLIWVLAGMITAMSGISADSQVSLDPR